MDWIKKNYDKLILLVMALVLLGSSVLLITNVSAFNQTFASIQSDASGSKKIKEVDIAALDTALKSVESPTTWQQKGTLFVSKPYTLREGGIPVPIDPNGPPLHEGVPNSWILDNDLDLLDSNVLQGDPDNDRFDNLTEFRANTNPRDPKSHPPYITKLRLIKVDSKAFRLFFAGYQASAEGNVFQINTLDVRQPTLFLKLGEAITGTSFKIIKFDEKTVKNAATDGMDDVSELTIEHVQTGAKLILIREKTTNSPDSIGTFRYLWDDTEFKKKKDDTFKLAPVEDVSYKVIDIKTTEAVIENLKTKEQTTLRIE